MAIISPRIGSDRTRLETVIPLNVPYLVFLDPSDICNSECKHCPTGNRSMVRKYRYPQFMSMTTFKKSVDQLKQMGKIKTLRMYKDGEPLLNPHFYEMVKYAADAGCFNHIDTTTNGKVFTGEHVRNIAQCGLTKIFISVPQLYDQKYVDLVGELFVFSEKMEIHVKIIDEGLPCGRIDKFYEDFDKISTSMSVEHLAPCWPNFSVLRESVEYGIYGNSLTSVTVCPYVFYSIAINSDGSVSLCFLDWQRRLILGNIQSQKISDIWNGKHHIHFQKMMLMHRRRFHPFCGNCGQLTHGSPDDIDSFSDELLSKIESMEAK